MDIFVYSDESGVFDKAHNDIFVFGGLIIFGKSEKDMWCRKYTAAERAIRKRYKDSEELKASRVSNKDKHKLVRSLNGCFKFGVVVKQQRVLDRIFESKKDKQRYLDYVYKIGLKRALESLIRDGFLQNSEETSLHVYVDEHSTATNGCYKLREGLEQEFKNGTYNYNYGTFYEPLFSNMKGVDLKFCNSATTTLVRAADHVANEVYHDALNGNRFTHEKMHITVLP